MNKTPYFSHNYDTVSDPKIKRLLAKHGMCGYGVFWRIVEELYKNANAMQAHYDSIAYDLHTSSDLVESVINDFDLFVINDGMLSSESIKQRLTLRNEKSGKYSANAKQRWDSAIAMQLHTKSDAMAMQLHTKPDAIALQQDDNSNATAMQLHTKPDAMAMQSQCNGNAIAMQYKYKDKEKEKNKESNIISNIHHTHTHTHEGENPYTIEFKKSFLTDTGWFDRLCRDLKLKRYETSDFIKTKITTWELDGTMEKYGHKELRKFLVNDITASKFSLTTEILR